MPYFKEEITYSFRLRLEEKIRIDVYNVIDTPKMLSPKERGLWIDIHTALEKLAFYYQDSGSTIFQH